MSEQQHTPGPWHLEQHNSDAAIPSSIGVCAGDPAGDPNEINVLGYAACETGTTAENIANARLWAASPELLAACKAWVDYFDTLTRYEDPDDKLAQIRNKYHRNRVEATRAAIAKAEGKTEPADAR